MKENIMECIDRSIRKFTVLPKPMLLCCQLDPSEQTVMKF